MKLSNLLLGSLAIVVLALPVRAEPKPPIKIAALLVLSGDLAMQNSAFRDGIDLAAARINAAGGIDGRRVEIVYEDTRANPKTANSAAKKVISVDGVRAALLASVIEAKGAGYDLNKANIPTITLWDASEDTQKVGKYVFSIGLWTPSTGEVAARFAVESLRARTAVLIDTEDEWSISISEFFTKHLEKSGGKVLRRFTFNPEEADFRAALGAVKALKPDVIYATVTLNFIPFFKQLRALKIDIPVLTSDIITEAHLAAEPGLFEGVYQTQVALPDNPATKRMVQDFERHLGRKCDQVQFSAWGYDGMNLLSRALAAGGDAPEKVQAALAATKGYPGASGEITFNEKGTAAKIARIFRIKNTQIALLPQK